MTALIVVLGIFIIINIIMTYKDEREREEYRRAKMNYCIDLGKKSPRLKEFERNLAPNKRRHKYWTAVKPS
jgi:hypothetical protein